MDKLPPKPLAEIAWEGNSLDVLRTFPKAKCQKNVRERN